MNCWVYQRYLVKFSHQPEITEEAPSIMAPESAASPTRAARLPSMNMVDEPPVTICPGWSTQAGGGVPGLVMV